MSVPEKSEVPEKPETPKEPEIPEKLETPEEPETPDAVEIPDTGDRAHVVERLAMAAVAAGSGGVVLLCVRRIYAKLMRREE